MYTSDGRYFTGEKTYWRATPEASGAVRDIECAVKAWDNEGRKFQSPVLKLDAEQVALATSSTKGHQEVIEWLVRDLYEINTQVEDEERQEGETGQDPGHVPDAKK